MGHVTGKFPLCTFVSSVVNEFEMLKTTKDTRTTVWIFSAAVESLLAGLTYLFA